MYSSSIPVEISGNSTLGLMTIAATNETKCTPLPLLLYYSILTKSVDCDHIRPFIHRDLGG